VDAEAEEHCLAAKSPEWLFDLFQVLLPSLHAELAASRSLAAALPRDYVPYLDPSSLSSSALSPLLSEPPTTATTDSDVPIWQPFVCILLQVVVVICCCKRRR